MTLVEGRRAKRVADTRRRIADVALDLFLAQGFGGTTIDEIAAGAEIGYSSFFRYYDTKEAVLFAEMVAPQAWLLEQLRARPAGEPALISIRTVCRTGDWPELDRIRLRKLRRIIKAEPALRDSQRLQLVNTFTGHLAACLRERDPHRSALEVQLATDLAVSWMQWAIPAHMRDGRPLSEHFAEAFAATERLVSARGSGS